MSGCEGSNTEIRDATGKIVLIPTDPLDPPFVFTVTLSEAVRHEVSVSYLTANGTADGREYTPTYGKLVFSPNETSKSVTVITTGDRTYEENETFLVMLLDLVNATITKALAVGTIKDNDLEPGTTTGGHIC